MQKNTSKTDRTEIGHLPKTKPDFVAQQKMTPFQPPLEIRIGIRSLR